MAQALKRLPLTCCKIYISDSRNARALQGIESVLRHHPQVPLLHVFEDHEYNRVGYTLAGSLSTADEHMSTRIPQNSATKADTTARGGEKRPLQAAIIDVVATALKSIDLGQHSGSHPRLGVVDHICLHPLGTATLTDTATAAQEIASEIGSELKVPAFLYGAAHPTGRQLDTIRRALGYFQPSSAGFWIGSNIFPSNMQPDYGPKSAPPESGIVVVGACPWVMNYNVPLASDNLEAAKLIARKVSERGGGLANVQAMALLHGDNCIEIACNLLDMEVSGPDDVQNLVSDLATLEEIRVRPGYLTGYSEDEILQLAMKKL